MTSVLTRLLALALLAAPMFADVVVDGKVVQSSNCRMRGLGAVLTVYGCTVNLGNYPMTVPTVQFTLTAATGVGTVKVYQTSTGTIVLEHPSAAGMTITNLNGYVAAVPTPQFPPLESRPIGEATNLGTNWATVSSYGDNPQWVPMTGSDGVLITQTGGIATLKADSTVVRTSGPNSLLGSYDFSGAAVTGLMDTTYNPLTSFRITEPFVSGVITGNGSLGALGWSTASAGTSSAGYVAGKGAYIVRSTGTTAGTNAPLYLSQVPQSVFGTADTWDLKWIVQLSVVDSDVTARVGANCSSSFGSITITDGLYFEKVSSNANWLAVVRTSSADATSVDTGVAANASNLLYFRLRKVSGTTYWSVNGGAETALANVPANAMCVPWTAVSNGAAAANKALRHYYFDLFVTGLTRP